MRRIITAMASQAPSIPPKARGFGTSPAGALASAAGNYTIDVATGAIGGGDYQGGGGQQHLAMRAGTGTFAPTPASRLTLHAVAQHRARWRGAGLDWGCGGGGLALLAAAGGDAVDKMIGIDFEAANVACARRNAEANAATGGGGDKCLFLRGDSFVPFEAGDRQKLADALAPHGGKLDFVLANPPASHGDDGFGFRRRILREAAPLLKPGAIVMLQALSYYGPGRVVDAAAAATAAWRAEHQQQQQQPGTPAMAYRYLGVAASSTWIPLGSGTGGYDQRPYLAGYVAEEARAGGRRYYCGPRADAGVAAGDGSVEPPGADGFFVESLDPETFLTATEALAAWEATGAVPLCRWQTHLLEWVEADGGDAGGDVGGGGGGGGGGGDAATTAAAKKEGEEDDGQDTLVQYVVVRRDLSKKLGWPLGAVVAQACHACAAVLHEHRADPLVAAYLDEGSGALDAMHKVVLGVKNEGQLRKLARGLADAGIDHRLWVEQPENSAVSLATKPYPRRAFAVPDKKAVAAGTAEPAAPGIAQLRKLNLLR